MTEQSETPQISWERVPPTLRSAHEAAVNVVVELLAKPPAAGRRPVAVGDHLHDPFAAFPSAEVIDLRGDLCTLAISTERRPLWPEVTLSVVAPLESRRRRPWTVVELYRPPEPGPYAEVSLARAPLKEAQLALLRRLGIETVGALLLRSPAMIADPLAGIDGIEFETGVALGGWLRGLGLAWDAEFPPPAVMVRDGARTASSLYAWLPSDEERMPFDEYRAPEGVTIPYGSRPPVAVCDELWRVWPMRSGALRLDGRLRGWGAGAALHWARDCARRVTRLLTAEQLARLRDEARNALADGWLESAAEGAGASASIPADASDEAERAVRLAIAPRVTPHAGPRRPFGEAGVTRLAAAQTHVGAVHRVADAALLATLRAHLSVRRALDEREWQRARLAELLDL